MLELDIWVCYSCKAMTDRGVRPVEPSIRIHLVDRSQRAQGPKLQDQNCLAGLGSLASCPNRDIQG